MHRTKPTVEDLRSGKGVLQRTNVLVRTAEEAAAAEQAGIDIINTEFDPKLFPQIREAAPTPFIVSGVLYGTLATTDDHLRAACDLYNLGADAIYCVASIEVIARLAAEGFPVMSHVGLIPSKRTWTGGYRAVGKTAVGALEIWRQVKRLEDAGALGAEIEVVPHEVASAISNRTALFMVSMGSGSGCDAQYLFLEDILGAHDGHYPRHSKRYRDFHSEFERLQRERVAAMAEFIDDVRSGHFPADGHVVNIDPAEFDEFRTLLGS